MAISICLAELGCYVSSGQEYLLQHNNADIQFYIRRGDYDKGMVKLLIIQAIQQQGYNRISFVANVSDRQKTKNSQSFDYFSARIVR